MSGLNRRLISSKPTKLPTGLFIYIEQKYRINASFSQTLMEHNVTYVRFQHMKSNTNVYRIYTTVRQAFSLLFVFKNKPMFREHLANRG